ncbi:MAG TPA: SusC/RagA family TonB-linked outer membrane protein [Longimicrobiales bacterium]|nr:SusC/RagA family TonB-linked outer membrane protein [Longimicrobiales bacterium]
MLRKTLLALLAVFLLLPTAVFAQNTLLSGVVRSDAQAPVAGALVRIPSLELETVTNSYGQYRIEIPAAQVNGQRVTIEVSSIGYSNAEVAVTLRPGAITQNITVNEQAIQLDEVVVTGTAGRQERRAQAAVISSVNAARLTEVAPITSVGQLLQARAPGVMIRNGSGTSGTSQTIRIRGLASMDGSSAPLIFVDGVRMDGGNRLGGVGGQTGSALNDIKVEEIESMEIVKGPAAATLYGSDASAGVINIITKKGRVGSGFVQTFNVEYGEADPNFTPMDNWGVCDQRALDRPTTYPACVGQPLGTILSDNPLNREKPFQDGRYRNLNYQLNGGGDGYGVFFSLGADQEDGTLPNNEYGHISSRANFNFFARENLRIEVGFGLARVKTQLPHNDNNIYGYLGGGFLGDPRTVGSARDGWYATNRQTLAISSIETVDRSTRFQPRASVNFTPWSWFTNRLMLGADMVRSESYQFWAKNDQGWWANGPMNAGQIGEDRDIDDRYTLEYMGTATGNLMENLRLDFSAGAQAIARRTDGVGVTGRGLVTNTVRSVNAAAELVGGSQSSSQDRDIGVMANATLAWMDRLYLKGGIRRDQSDAFGIESEPFYSPSVGVSYVISDEPFFQNAIGFLPDGALTTLRLRTAYGISGRHPSGGARSTYSPSTNQISQTGIAIGVRPGATGNPLLKAETGKEIEVGFDAGFLNDRLGIEFTYFRKRLEDQIDNIPVPPSLGVNGPDMNIGVMENKGIELVANARLITRDNIALDVRGIANTLSNKIIDLGGVPESATRKVGYPLTGYWDYEILEIFPDNDSVVVSDSLRLLGNGSNYPGWEAGLSTTLTLFQNLSFYTQFDARGDVMVFDGTNQFRDRQFGQGEAAVRGAAAFGTDANGNPTDAARLEYLSRFGPFYTEDGRQLNRNSVDGGYAQDGGFIRLREASINYSIPTSLVQQYMRARSATLGVSMRNLRTWTDFTGLDPETGQFLTVPMDRRWTVRFMFTF